VRSAPRQGILTSESANQENFPEDRSNINYGPIIHHEILNRRGPCCGSGSARRQGARSQVARQVSRMRSEEASRRVGRGGQSGPAARAPG
jgi:hypothetical protein